MLPIERTLCIFIFLMLSQAFLPTFDPARAGSIAALRPVLLFLANGAMVLLLLSQLRRIPFSVVLSAPVLMLGVAGLSLVWSLGNPPVFNGADQ